MESDRTTDLRRSWEQAFYKYDNLPIIYAAKIFIFGFKADELLCNGRPGLVDLSQYLREKIWDITAGTRDVGAKIFQGKSRNVELQPSSSAESSQKFILIAHGIASLLLQETLAHFKFTTSELALRLKGAIFLDPPKCKSASDWERYRTNFLRTISTNVRSKEWLEFSMVTTTTRNFELLLENKQPAIAGCILQQPEQSQEV